MGDEPVYLSGSELDLVKGFAGFRHGAENTVSLAPCDDARIVVLILFEIAAPVFFDGGRSGCRDDGCGQAPVPLWGGGSGQKNVVSIGTVDDVPAEIDARSAVPLGSDGLWPGCDKDEVGPGTGTHYFITGIEFACAHLEEVHVLAVEIVDPDGIEVMVYITAFAAGVMCAVGPDTFYFIAVCIGHFIPGNHCTGKILAQPLLKTGIPGFFHGCLGTDGMKGTDNK